MHTHHMYCEYAGHLKAPDKQLSKGNGTKIVWFSSTPNGGFALSDFVASSNCHLPFKLVYVLVGSRIIWGLGYSGNGRTPFAAPAATCSPHFVIKSGCADVGKDAGEPHFVRSHVSAVAVASAPAATMQTQSAIVAGRRYCSESTMRGEQPNCELLESEKVSREWGQLN